MSDVAQQGASPVSNSARVRVTIGPLVGPVLSRVVGMLAARAEFPVDRLDDALLVVDALAAHSAQHVPNGHVTVWVDTSPAGLVLRVGPLVADGGSSLVEQATLPGVGNVLERIADSVSVEEHSEASQEMLVIELRSPA